jgi:hypothetical protein
VPSTDLEANLAEFHQVCVGLEQVAEQVGPMASQYVECSQKWLNARAASRLIGMGVSVDPQTFGLADGSIESAKALEEEARAERESLRESLREVIGALNRKFQLALAIRLAGGGDGGAEPVSPDQVAGLVDQLNRSAQDYGSREDAMDALTVLNHIRAIRQSAGETPAVSRAMETQSALVSSFISSTSSAAAEVAPKPGLQLQINRQPSHAGPAEVEGLRQKTRQWFADYQSCVRQLAKVALEVGQPTI